MTPAAPADPEGRFAVRAGRLFDGERWLRPPTVIVEGSSVVAAGAALPGDLPKDLPVVDLGDDATLLPGLVDCHQHLCFNGRGTLEEQVTGVDDEALTVRARAAARRALAGGVTTLRDLGDRGWVTLPLRDDDTLPTILAAGPPITRLEGHCWYLGGGCDGEASLRAAVRERAARGCDVVKVMATGGFNTPTFPMWKPQFSLEDLRTIVDEAHAAGLPVASHCHGLAGVERSLDAGVDSIEHCSFINAEGRIEPTGAVLERLAASAVVVSLTLGRLPGSPLPPLLAANEAPARATRRRLRELGATLVVGTDAGIGDAKPHDVIVHALADLQEAGMTATEGLRALTSTAARACGVDGRRGRLVPGSVADILAVAGDPGRDPLALASVAAVWKAGRRVRAPAA